MTVSLEALVRRWQNDVARDPGSASFIPLADHYRGRGRFDVARRVCTRGLARQPENVEGHYVLGRIYRDLGELQMAGDEWDIALRLDPSHVAARRAIGLLRLEQGDRVGAESHLRLALTNDPDDPRIRRALEYLAGSGRRRAPSGRYWEALSARLHGPIEWFRREAKANTAIFLDGSGRVLARSGGPVAFDLAAFATLAAGTHAASREIARIMGQPGFSQLYQGRGKHQIFMGAVDAPHGEILLLATFDDDTTIGLVRAIFREMSRDLANSSWPDPEWEHANETLEASLAASLRRAAARSGSGMAGS